MKGRNLLVQPKPDCCGQDTHGATHGGAAGAAEAGNLPIDPVCGMRVEPAKAAGHYEYRGTPYYFCGLSCLQRFKAAPESFLKPMRGDVSSLLARIERARPAGDAQIAIPSDSKAIPVAHEGAH